MWKKDEKAARNMVRDKGNRLLAYVKDYVIFDLETTGLNPTEDAIIEISGIKVRDHAVADTFSTLVNPGMPIPYAATAVNGITDAMVRQAPEPREAIEAFLDFIGTDILVGHNIHTFDTNFLYDGAVRALGRKVQNDYIDTLPMAKRCLPGQKKYTLTALAAGFGFETDGAHRALADCEMNRKCYERLGMLWEAKQQKAETKMETADACPECGCLLVRRKGRYGSFLGCSGFPLCRYTQNG